MEVQITRTSKFVGSVNFDDALGLTETSCTKELFRLFLFGLSPLFFLLGQFIQTRLCAIGNQKKMKEEEECLSLKI